MSISPTDANSPASSPSSRASSSNPSSDHGFCFPPQHQPQGRFPDRQLAGGGAASPGSVEIAGSGSLFGSPDSMVSIYRGSQVSPHNLTEMRSGDSGKGSHGHASGTNTQDQFADGGETSSQGRSDKRGHFRHGGKRTDGFSPFHLQQMAAGYKTPQGNLAQSGARKSQMVNANHLLNFHYDPIQRSQPRLRTPRRQQKVRPFNRDLFLQANYKFVVLDTGNYLIEVMDPDKMLEWEDVVCVRYSTPSFVQCPICLETPLSPQITSCGHIFCFPCILRYLLMGDEDHRGECWKKCPLCFMMISSKDLYTVYIDHVKQYDVGDHAHFSLLARRKNSFLPYERNLHGADNASASVDLNDLFSKFTLTSDVELSVREARSSLDEWLAKADTGMVDDLERLPYVCAAVEQLEQRMKSWAEHRAASSSPTRISLDKVSPTKLGSLVESYESPHKSFFSSNNGGKDVDDECGYVFYQVTDGQHIILHPLNMKCLLHHYKSYDMLPPRIDGKILQLETVTQSEAVRRRYRFLSHFSLTTTFQLCEIDLRDMLPPDSFSPYLDEIKKREKQRKLLARKERQAKGRVEGTLTCARPIFSCAETFANDDAAFSLDDFEALGSSVVPSTSPPVTSEKKKFSDVTRLGYAAAHDSPSLRVEEPASFPDTVQSQVSNATGPSVPTQSFASVISTSKAVEIPVAAKMNGFGKKGKKPTRVLLSTSGGRRY